MMDLLILILLAIFCFIAFNKKACEFFERIPYINKTTGILNNKKIYLSIVIFLFVLGAVSRLFLFPQYPLGVNQDGAMAAVDAKALADYGTDRFGMYMPVHFYAWGFGNMSVLLSYLMVPFIKIFGLSTLTMRLPMMIVSLASFYIIFSLTKKYINKNAALFILLFLIVSPWHFMQSRWALDCNLLPHFMLFSIFFLYKGVTEKKIYLYISMVFFALTMYTYGIALYSVPLILVILCAYLLIKKEVKWHQALICLAVFLAIALPILLMVYLNMFQKPTIYTPFFTIPYYPETVRKSDILFFMDGDKFAQLRKNFNALTGITFFQVDYLPWNAINEFGTNYLFSLPLTVTGLVFTSKRITSKNSRGVRLGNFFILVWLLVSVFSGLIINEVNINRINIIFYPLILFTGIGIYEICRRFKPAAAVIGVILCIYFTSFTSSYFGKHSETLGHYFMADFGTALTSVEQEKYDTIYITQNTQYDGASNVSEILTLYYYKIDAKYFQGVADEYREDGSTLAPYKERYQYINFRYFSRNVDPSENAAYVLNTSEINYEIFTEDIFRIDSYGSFCVITPLNPVS